MTDNTYIDLGENPTEQQILDAGYLAITKQGKPSYKKGKGCRYRSNGERCILGWFIPDGDYDEDMEGKGVESLLSDWSEDLPEWFQTHQEFLSDLQSAHDLGASDVDSGYTPVESWLKKFGDGIAFLAKEHELDSPVPE